MTQSLAHYGGCKSAENYMAHLYEFSKVQLVHGKEGYRGINAIIPLKDGMTMIAMTREKEVRYTCLLVIPRIRTDDDVEDDVRRDQIVRQRQIGDAEYTVMRAKGVISTWRIAAEQTARMAGVGSPGEEIIVTGWRSLESMARFHRARFGADAID